MNNILRIGIVLFILVGAVLILRLQWWQSRLTQSISAPIEPTSHVFTSQNGVRLSVDVPPSIGSPLLLKGSAPGTWYFEASFPVVLTDWEGKIVAQGHAQAKADWMTTNDVPFEVTLEFTAPTNKKNGSLILQKDNPSGLPAHDDSVEIPILFQ